MKPGENIFGFLRSLLNGDIRTADYIALLIQTERWLSDKEKGNGQLNNIEEFSNIVSRLSTLGSAQFLVILCPVSARLRFTESVVLAERKLVENLATLPGVEVLPGDRILEMYPADNYGELFDEISDKIAQIPYSNLGFATLGTIIARWIKCRTSVVKKIIVVDCDNTLWSGIVAESGVKNIEICEGRIALQKFLVKQSRCGRLICLCSKNEPADVWDVFAHNEHMVIRREDCVAAKINWQPKAKNLRDLSTELSLGLDAFIFIDDDPFECACIREVCPDVLTLQIPANPNEISSFLREVWEFDIGPLTHEDRNRRRLYQENTVRNNFRNEFSTLTEFIAKSELVVSFAPLGVDSLDRVKQLLVRTNQFNLNGRGQSQAFLRQIMASTAQQCITVNARDRFGDYGLVGAFIITITAGKLFVETLLLSCRVLGRGVEEMIANDLADRATFAGVQNVEFDYVATPKNNLISKFLRRLQVYEIEGVWCISSRKFQQCAMNYSAQRAQE